MKAIGVSQYGPISNFETRDIADPGEPQGRELLIEVKAMSVNPIDNKIRNGTYDDAPEYYEHAPKGFHIIGLDCAGVVLKAGPDCEFFKAGDEVFWVTPTTRQGCATERMIMHESAVGRKPSTFDFVQAAAMPLTYGTAYQAIVEQLGVQQDEQAAILIINGAGGVGSMASQISRHLLNLPVVISTASRPETIEWSKKMGATHVLNHREDLKAQIQALKLDVPLKYIFIVHSTAQYLSVCAEICEPFGKICSVVQSSVNFYGTQFLSKSLTFCWCWLGTSAYHQLARQTYRQKMEELAANCDSGKIQCHLSTRLKLTKEGLMEAHRLIQSGTVIGKIGLGVDEDGPGEAFT